ncbi:hypothetical protein AAH979_01550 [Plantactinospora sp. ZYX-F-223]
MVVGDQGSGDGHLATHRLPLDEAPEGYAMFREKRDGWVRAVFTPDESPR